MKGREIINFINKEGLLDEDLFLTDVYDNTYGYMTVEEYAASIGTGPAVVKTMINRGDLDHIVVLGQILIPNGRKPQKINKYMNEPKEEYESGYFLNTGNIIAAHDIRYMAHVLITDTGRVKSKVLGFLG